MGRWVLGAGLTALVAFAHAQPAYSPHGGGFQRAPMVRPGGTHGGWGAQGAAPTRRETGASWIGYGGSGRNAAVPTRVADQGGWHERGGNRPPERSSNGGNAGYGNGYGGYRNSPITPVSAETRQVPHPPADSPVRTGSIREDVARYNEERGAFRPFPRNGGEVPRPPMSSPYRN